MTCHRAKTSLRKILNRSLSVPNASLVVGSGGRKRVSVEKCVMKQLTHCCRAGHRDTTSRFSERLLLASYEVGSSTASVPRATLRRLCVSCARDGVTGADNHFNRLHPWLPIVQLELCRYVLTLATAGFEATVGGNRTDRLPSAVLDPKEIPLSTGRLQTIEQHICPVEKGLLLAVVRQPFESRRPNGTSRARRTVESPSHLCNLRRIRE